MSKTIVVIGGGAAGFFGAISYAALNPEDRVILAEKTRQPLSKVRISGGGRCNVTHDCYDPSRLALHYPRGNKALLGPFTRFQPKDTIEWFSSRGVSLKVEPDGRIFPSTDQSQTIIDCLYREAQLKRVEIRLQAELTKIIKSEQGFRLTLGDGPELFCDQLLVATGSNTKIFQMLEALGHQIQPPVPSLFTFNIQDPRLEGIPGVSIPKVRVKLASIGLEEMGPLLITHWGLSGPAILKLSAWGARLLHDLNYETILQIEWLPEISKKEAVGKIRDAKKHFSRKAVSTESIFPLPKQLWKKLLEAAEIDFLKPWAHVSNVEIEKIMLQLFESQFNIRGKSTYKEEFVTCGGVDLKQVNFQTMESRLVPGLFFAGEVLDIDGITGGFNFQNAWTTGWLAAHGMSAI